MEITKIIIEKKKKNENMKKIKKNISIKKNCISIK